MSTYPASPIWSYPVTRTLEFSTQVFEAQDTTEQRIMRTPGQESWELSYPHLSLTDRDSLLAFFESSKGDFDSGIDFTFNGVTFTGCFIDAATIKATEKMPNLYGLSWTIRQVWRAADTGSLGSFPALSTGAATQRPYTFGRAFETVTTRTEGGRQSFYRRAASMRSWSVGGTVLIDTEAQALWDYFRKAHGKYLSFAFVDPDTTVSYPTCRFADDSLEWKYVGPNTNTITATVQQLP